MSINVEEAMWLFEIDNVKFTQWTSTRSRNELFIFFFFSFFLRMFPNYISQIATRQRKNRIINKLGHSYLNAPLYLFYSYRQKHAHKIVILQNNSVAA